MTNGFSRGNQQLCALQAFQQFDARLTELQSTLRRDKDTLAVLDAALKAGATMEVASSVRDVARLLSEKQEASNQVQSFFVHNKALSEIKIYSSRIHFSNSSVSRKNFNV